MKLQLSRLLGEHRISQAELARKTGIRPNTINDMYHCMGDRISLDHLDRICEALGCELYELIIRVSNPIPKTQSKLIWDERRVKKKK